jgi:metal-sulfur cluster biosynthetic enzyme
MSTPRPQREWSPAHVMAMLRYVNDVDLNVNIVDLGLVYRVQVNAPRVDVEMTLTSPACPYGPYLIQQVKEAVLTLDGITEVHVEIVWDPPWNWLRISEDVRLDLGFDV